jgi:hypothetical protein
LNSVDSPLQSSCQRSDLFHGPHKLESADRSFDFPLALLLRIFNLGPIYDLKQLPRVLGILCTLQRFLRNVLVIRFSLLDQVIDFVEVKLTLYLIVLHSLEHIVVEVKVLVNLGLKSLDCLLLVRVKFNVTHFQQLIGCIFVLNLNAFSAFLFVWNAYFLF